jgi:hypothetical protein
MPDQSGESSVDLHTEQILPYVIALHFLQASSLGTYLEPPPFFSLPGGMV